MKKLDPTLRQAVRALEGGGVSEADPALPIGLSLKFTGSLADLEAIGFRRRTLVTHPTKGYKIATGSIPLARLAELASIGHVVQVEAPRSFVPLLDRSNPEVRAEQLRTGNPSRQGRGVVIGIIDSGIDWRHKGFYTEQNGVKTSRIISIWDQTAKATEKSGSPGPKGVGRTYSRAQLNDGLAGRVKLPKLDGDPDHGTSVAGIAAGNGRGGSCCCNCGDNFIGIAPQAELIVVRLQLDIPRKGVPGSPLKFFDVGESEKLIDALDYIFEFAHEGGPKPTVVNLSLGDNIGPHDGSTNVEQAIDAMVATSRGRAVVVSAGNSGHVATSKEEGDMNSHAEGRVPKNDRIDLEFEFPKFAAIPATKFQPERLVEPPTSATMDLWYDRAGTLSLELLEGNVLIGAAAHGADFVTPQAHPLLIVIDGTAGDPFGRDNNFRIRFRRRDGGALSSGTWTLRLTNPTGVDVNFHCWIRSNTRGPRFFTPSNAPNAKIHASSASTVECPATAEGAIAVANYHSKTSCCDNGKINVIDEASSRGPQVHPAASALPKPDLAAPGNRIMTAKANPGNEIGDCCSCCPDVCCHVYENINGTSASAPHVTGAVALMLEANPLLLWHEIRDHLRKTARDPPPGEPATAWGEGKLDVAAAVAAVLQAGGGGGGPTPVPGDPIAIRREDERWMFDPGAFSREALRDAIRTVSARLRALPDGQRIAAAVSRHFSEVRRLVNTNRRVATLWHRGDGPRLLRRLLHGALDPRIMPGIASSSQRRYLERFCELLIRFGSARLRAGLEQHQRVILALLETPLSARVPALPVPAE
jgi:subtilisin family serine protease